MTPIELYEFLRSQYSDFEVDSICQIEKTCKRVGNTFLSAVNTILSSLHFAA